MAKAKAKTKAKAKPKAAAKKAAKPSKKPALKARASKPKGVSYIPEAHHTITPHLVIKGASQAIEFYKRAFNAVEMGRMPGPDGQIMHAELRIGDSVLYVCDEFPMSDARAPQSVGGTTFSMHLYVPDVDALYQRAVAAGAKVVMPPMDAPWGDRYGKVQDPFGHSWGIATHKEDLTGEEIAERMAQAFGGAG